MSEIVDFISARIAEERDSIPERGDDPFTPHGQHWSEIPFPMAAAAQALNVLDHLQAITEVADNMIHGPLSNTIGEDARVAGTAQFRLTHNGARILSEVASIWHEHPDFRPEWAT